MQGAAQRINAGHDRTDLAIDNRGRRYVGGGVDDGTHRILHWRHCAQSRETGNETTGDNGLFWDRIVPAVTAHRPTGWALGTYYLDDIIGHKVADFCPES